MAWPFPSAAFPNSFSHNFSRSQECLVGIGQTSQAKIGREYISRLLWLLTKKLPFHPWKSPNKQKPSPISSIPICAWRDWLDMEVESLTMPGISSITTSTLPSFLSLGVHFKENQGHHCTFCKILYRKQQLNCKSFWHAKALFIDELPKYVCHSILTNLCWHCFINEAEELRHNKKTPWPHHILQVFNKYKLTSTFKQT